MPDWQLPFPSQHPLQFHWPHVGGGGTHCWFWHASPMAWQFWHALPPTPHAANEPPGWQAPFVSQQPAHVCALQPDPPWQKPPCESARPTHVPPCAAQLAHC
jgi:hypothetical protein